jgi:BirA family biotin operon repressor/biotin-[acetyl-CoA-carboxylase] ligase
MIVADHQTMGRGRRGRIWFSPPYLGLWATLILCPRLAGKELFTLGLVAAVAICKVIEKLYAANPVIQWPNDLYMDKEKFGGILVEMQSDCNHVIYAMLGMGINLNQRKDDFPPELQGTATSLRCVLGVSVDRMGFIENLTPILRSELQTLYDRKFEGIKGEYCERSNLLNNRVKIRLESGIVEGRVLDFGSNGELIVSVDDGSTMKLAHGEVDKIWR